MEFEKAFTAAVESTLGLEVSEAPAIATQETAATTIQTLAFTVSASPASEPCTA